MTTPAISWPGLADRLDRLQRRAAGGDDVLDDQAAVVGVEERALDAPLQAVLLGLLAHEEGLDVGAAGQRGARGRRRRPSSGRRPRSRSHSRARAATSSAERGEAGGPQDRALGVDVVLRDLRRWSARPRRRRGRGCATRRSAARGPPCGAYPIGRAGGPPADGRDRGERDRAAQLRPVRHRRDARRVRRRAQAGDRRARGHAGPSDPSPDEERARERAHSRVREADRRRRRRPRARRSPGSSSGSDSSWVRRGVPALLALDRLRLRPRPSSPATPGDALDRRRSARLGFGAQADFAIGVEEELILVDPATRALSHTGRRRARRAWATPTPPSGFAHPDTYAALVELASPVARDAGEGVGRAQRAAGARARGGRHASSAPASTPTAPSATSCTSTSRAITAIVEQLQRPHQAHADLRAARPRRDARRRDRDPRLQRAARAAAAAAGAGRQLALLARPRLGPGHRARAALPRLPARRHPARLRLLRRLRRDRRRASSRPATCPTTRSCGGTSARTRAWARSRCARWTASRRCGRRPAWPRSSTAWRAPRRTSRRDAWTPREVLMEASFTRRARRAARAAAAGRRAAPGAARSPRAALERARPHAARARLGRRAGGHRADPRRGQRRRPPARRPRPRRDAGAARPARGRGRGRPTGRRRRCRRS